MPPRAELPGDDERRRELGARIRRIRLGAGIGLREMARDLSMSSSWLHSVERGDIALDALRLADVAEYLGETPGYFLGVEEDGATESRQRLSRPRTRMEWRRMFVGEEERGRAHWELERVFCPPRAGPI